MNKTLTYHWHGEHLLPDLALNDCGLPLGRYGELHKEYLRREKPALYAGLLLSEQLYPLCREVDDAARTRFAAIGDDEVAHKAILSELVYC